jgi:hypothetical protein
MSSLSLAYAFIGTLPSYAVDTVEQARKFFTGPIYFIISDLESPYLLPLQEYGVTLVPYELVRDPDFTRLIEETYSKFAIVDSLKGREKLFIYSFERFYLLHSLMVQRDLEDVFFLELDNLIYDNPEKWLASFRQRDMAYTFEQKGRSSSGICYIKHAAMLKGCIDSFSEYIRTDTGFIQEMTALYRFWQTNQDRVQFVPTHWSPSHGTVAPFISPETYEHYESYGSIFDGAGLGIYIGGLDPHHTGGRIEKNVHKLQWYDIDYRSYTYKWVPDEEGRRIPYVFTGTEWIRINNLHIHSKDLRDNM